MLGSDSLLKQKKEIKEGTFIYGIMKMLTEYFERKKTNRGGEYDPWMDMNMFFLQLKGFAITYVFMDP
jgi:hypothetical protein